MNKTKNILLVILTITLFGCEASINPEQSHIELRKGTAQANGISIAYESFGNDEDETILLIQGTGAQLTAWPVELCEHLALSGYRVIRFDNRDVGLSSKLDSLGMPDWPAIFPLIGTCDESKLPYTLLDMAKDAVGLLDALQIEKSHIVGASMGGAIAQLVAIHFPDRTLSLTSIMASSGNPKRPSGDPAVLQKMALPPPQTENKDTLAKYMFDLYKAIGSPAYPTEDSTLMNMARQSIERSWHPVGNARQAAAVIIGDNCDRRTELSKIATPTVVVHGENDPVVNIAAGKEVAEAIPDAKFISIPGMGHDLPVVLVPKLNGAILMATEKVK